MRGRAAVVAAGAALAAALPAPAGASDGEGSIGLSADGVEWASTLERPLFDAAHRWVPGEQDSVSFLVRNEAGTRAELDVTLLVEEDGGAEGAAADTESGWLELATRVADGAWTDARSPAVAGTGELEPGEHTRVGVRVGMATHSPETSMNDGVALAVRVQLRDARATGDGASGDGATDDPPGGLLPDTGAGLGPAAVLGAVLAAGIGAALVRRSRRTEEERVDMDISSGGAR